MHSERKASGAPAAMQHVVLAAWFIQALGLFLFSPVQMLSFGTCVNKCGRVWRGMWHRSDVAVTQDGLPAVETAPPAVLRRLPEHSPLAPVHPWNRFTSEEAAFMSSSKCLCFDPSVLCHHRISSMISSLCRLLHVGMRCQTTRILERSGSQPARGDLIPVVSVKICRQWDVAALLAAARKSLW